MQKIALHKLLDKKLLIIPILAAVIALLIILIFNILPSESDRIVLKNPSALASVSRSDAKKFKTSLVRLLEANGLISAENLVDDVEIRADSVSTFTDYSDGRELKTTTFLVDIDSLAQTFFVTIYDSNKPLTDLAVQITCPTLDDSKYPNSTCVGVYGDTSQSVSAHLPYEFSLASGEKVLVKKLESSSDGKQILQIYLYSCDASNPPISATETAIKNWLDALADPNRDYHTLNVRSGYCPGDAI